MDISQSQRNQALYAYEKTVRNAFAEVNNSLDAITRYQEQLSELLAQQEVARDAAHCAEPLSQRLFILSGCARRTAYTLLGANQRGAGENNLLLAQIDLYKALGGGWVNV